MSGTEAIRGRIMKRYFLFVAMATAFLAAGTADSWAQAAQAAESAAGTAPAEPQPLGPAAMAATPAMQVALALTFAAALANLAPGPDKVAPGKAGSPAAR